MTRKEKRLSRVTALQILYARELSGNEPGDLLAYLAKEDNSQLSPDVVTYSGKLSRITISEHENLDKLIQKRSRNWDMDRITLIDRLILRLSISEMFFMDDIPPKVSISEAVEIAKLFSTEDSSSFVNGILDSIYNDLVNGEFSEIQFPNKDR